MAVVLDLYSRRAVGWPMQSQMTTQLVTDPLMMALWRCGQPDALLHHSDRGSQSSRDRFQRLLGTLGITCSMSRSGNCWDTQSKIHFERRTDLTRAGIGRAAFALTCRSDSGVP